MPASKSHLDPTTSEFVVENYNSSPPFSNFLPGIAGRWGIPLWAYYVNRGQAMATLGVRDKDGQILEFQSFNQACMRIEREGFRTFLRVRGGAVYEPFRRTQDARVTQSMRIAPAELTLRETNAALGIEIEVVYYGLCNVRVAGLVRHVRLKNLKRRALELDWVDGLPRILPYGLDQQRIKGIPRHAEGMMGVFERGGAALYRLKQTADDSERVGELESVHFYLRVGRDARGLIFDPEAVFGEPFNYDEPYRFAASGARGVLQVTQLSENKTPSAMSVQTSAIEPGETVELTSIIGYSARERDLDALIAKTRHPAFLETKREENRQVIAEIADTAFTLSASAELDAYARQDFVDNVIRGGMPILLSTRTTKSAFYLYSRQNGDLERDYHHFVLEPTYLSQGTGHYRSVLQNRRTDSWFFPETEDNNLRTFVDLIQLDGYNPLEVLGLSYRAADRDQARSWAERRIADPRSRREISDLLDQGFAPGELVMRLEDAIALEPERRTAVLDEVLSFCEENEIGGIHEGFWVDHWHYNIDLLEVLAMVYPDRMEKFLLEQADYTFFDNPDIVVPRSERSCAVSGKVRAYGAVRRSPEKLARIASRDHRKHTVRTQHGDGELYRTTLLVKLLTIVVNRLATLDPHGTGIEMEAGKPGWNDSMNGLPGLFGSGLSETLELARTLRFLLDSLRRVKNARTRTIAVFEELAGFLRELEPKIARRVSSRSPRASFVYWDESNTLKEAYRERTLFGVSGKEIRIPLREITAFLQAGSELLERIFTGSARAKVVAKSGVPYTYFVNDVTASEPTGRDNHLGLPTVVPRDFSQRPVKLFLEGPVHWMKHRRGEAREVYDAVVKSPLFDRKLKMYKSCENMRGESPELGRAVGAYPRGWIENESIYLHMEYKYLLEILRAGMCEEFWRDARRALIPFLDPAVYGRSTLEGASFIVSSAYADESLHGRAFQPRLSGITAEFLHIWILAVAGEHPLRLDRQGKLELALEPRLPGWLFTERETRRAYLDKRDGWTELVFPAGCFAFKFLGHTLVVYENAARKDTFGPGGARPRAYVLEYRSGRSVRVAGKSVPLAHARAVRAGNVSRIDVLLR